MVNQAMMITKIKNIYIMLLHAISKEDISIVDHYLDDALTNKYKEIIENNKKNNVRQVYRQPNISNVSVITENDEYVTFECDIKYISYLVDRKTNKFVSGDNKNRISKTVDLVFRKNSVEKKVIYYCPNCGAGLKINSTGICSYCGITVDERFSPYVLCSIK